MLIADAHVHLYPVFDFDRLVRAAEQNFAVAQKKARLDKEQPPLALLLTEREDCHVFKELSTRSFLTESEEWCVKSTRERDALLLENNHGGSIYVFAGRQINTRERIEVHAIGRDLEIKDGQPFHKTLGEVVRGGAVPVLPWSPGKWFGERGRAVQKVLPQMKEWGGLISDVTLRPYGWSTPTIMKEALALGIQRIFGSDPLPFPSEEDRVGSYATVFTGAFDPLLPVVSLKRLLVNGAPRPLGRRDLPHEFAVRLWRNKKVRRAT